MWDKTTVGDMSDQLNAQLWNTIILNKTKLHMYSLSYILLFTYADIEKCYDPNFQRWWYLS